MFSLGFEALQSEFECVKQLGVSQGAPPPPPAQMLTPANSIREAIVTLYYSASGISHYHLSAIHLILGLRMRMMPRAALCQCALYMWIGHVEPRCQKLLRVQEQLQLNRA